MVKYDAGGTFVRAAQAGGGTEEAYGSTFDSAGDSFLTGFFEVTAAFGETALTSLGGEELFLAKFGTGNPTAIGTFNEQPTTFSLAQNYPNPFNPQTTIHYNLAQPENVTLQIFDIAGRLVRTLYSGKQMAGAYPLNWDGTDARGQIVSSGLYLYQLQAGKQRASRRMLFLK